jgi:hypothetical protein
MNLQGAVNKMIAKPIKAEKNMGTIEIHSRNTKIGGEEVIINAWTTTTDFSMGEWGFVVVDWVYRNARFSTSVPNWIFSNSFFDQFLFALNNDEGFARKFEIKQTAIKKYVEKITIHGQIIDVDSEIAAAIKLLNDNGFKTKFCCRGNFFEEDDHSTCAYLEADTLPSDLIRVAQDAGFSVSSSGIKAEFTPEYQFNANKKFCFLINDWANKEIKNTNEYVPQKDDSYRKKMREKFRIPNLVIQGFRKNKIINFLEIKNPKFKDFAALRSGRDQFTKMDLHQLVKQIDDDYYKEIEQKLESSAEKAKAIRWILRGLSKEHAIRKVWVDEEITRNRQQKRVLSLAR